MLIITNAAGRTKKNSLHLSDCFAHISAPLVCLRELELVTVWMWEGAERDEPADFLQQMEADTNSSATISF